MSSSTGRHRAKTTSHAARLAAVSVAAIATGLISTGTADAAPSLDSIAHCESSGNPRATNGSHFGLFQFDLPTWRSVGGSGNPMNASVAEQYARAQQLMASRGTQPWNASKSCWQSRVGGVMIKEAEPKSTPKAVKKAKLAAPAAAKPKVTKPKEMKPKEISVPRVKAVVNGDYTVIAGDTLSQIAARQNVPGGWRELFKNNSDKITNPHKIFPGQQLDL